MTTSIVEVKERKKKISFIRIIISNLSLHIWLLTSKKVQPQPNTNCVHGYDVMRIYLLYLCIHVYMQE